VIAPVLRYREAGDEDAALVFHMLVHAANWHPSREPLTRDQVAAEPKLSHYAAGWPWPRDLGFVAEDEEGVGRGAAWLRYSSDADPSYVFVDATTTMATRSRWCSRSPELGELLGQGSALVLTGSSGGGSQRRVHRIGAEHPLEAEVGKDRLDPAAACAQLVGLGGELHPPVQRVPCPAAER
jgi:hypothetical protein